MAACRARVRGSSTDRLAAHPCLTRLRRRSSHHRHFHRRRLLAGTVDRSHAEHRRGFWLPRRDVSRHHRSVTDRFPKATGTGPAPKPHYELVFDTPAIRTRASIWLRATSTTSFRLRHTRACHCSCGLAIWTPAISIAAAQAPGGWRTRASASLISRRPTIIACIENVRPDVLVLLSTRESDIADGVASIQRASRTRRWSVRPDCTMETSTCMPASSPSSREASRRR